MRAKHWGALLCLTAVWLLASSTAASGQTTPSSTLHHVRVGVHPTYTRIVFELDRPAAYEWQRKDGSEEFLLTLLATEPAGAVRPAVSAKNPHINTIALSRPTPTATAVAITAKTALTPHLFTLDHPDRVVVDFFPASQASSRLLARSSAPSSSTSPAASPDPPSSATLVKAAPPPRTVRTIVIDPGHGGKDPGAIGRNGLKEKDVVLDIGRRLKKLLEQQGHRVIMTRNDDTFIPLSDRTQLANSREADLFVSIHANANPKRSTKGMQIYLLG